MKQRHVEGPLKISVVHKCALRLLHLYPRAWRERYADEAIAVLEERSASARTLLDLLLGMLDAHLHAELFTERKVAMLQRLRNSQITIFSLFVCFSLFWALYSLTYASGFPSWDLSSPAPDYTFVFPLVRMLGLFTILTTLLGGCAFIGVALNQSFARDRENIPPFICTLLSGLIVAQFCALIMLPTILQRVPRILSQFVGLIFPSDVLLFLLFALLGVILRLRQGSKNGKLSLRFLLPTLLPVPVILEVLGILLLIYAPGLSWYIFANKYRMLFAIPALLFFVGIICCGIIYLARNLRRIEFSQSFLRLTFLLASLTVLAMGAIAGLLLYEALVIYSHVNAQGMKLLSTPFLGVIVVFAALLTVCAGVSLWRGFCARRELALG